MAKGKVAQVIGTVVDVEFPPEELPALFNAVEVDADGGKIVLEVQEHMGNNWVRCLALSPTEGLGRASVDIGLLALFNVLFFLLGYLMFLRYDARWS